MRTLVLLILHTLLTAVSYAQTGTPVAVTTPEGLEYVISTTAPQSRAVRTGDMVEVYYTTTLADGTPLASVERGTSPYSFVVGNGDVLKGWDLAARLMHVGDRGRFTIPSSLAYGERQFGKIPANATIILELEIIKAYPAFYTVADSAKHKTPSGLQYAFVYRDPAAENIIPGNYVAIHYTGYIIDQTGKRTIFDTSVKKGVAAMTQIGVKKFIAGLEEGISMMHVGDSASFIIPPALGYGNQANQLVPANSTLGFDVYVQEQSDPFFDIDNPIYSKDPELEFSYCFVRDSSGATAKINENVVLDLVGYYLMPNGARRIFQSTYETHQPQIFRLGKGIENPAWLKILQQSSVGDQVIMAIPPEKARMELKKMVPENVTVFFEFTLREIQAPSFLNGAAIDTITTNAQVIVMPVQYGNGLPVDSTCTVYVHYTGYTIDSTGQQHVFDTSFDRGSPLQVRMPAHRVIRGWEEALLTMHEGDQARIIVPSAAGYGEAGIPPVIMPNEILYFDMYVMKVISNNSR